MGPWALSPSDGALMGHFHPVIGLFYSLEPSPGRRGSGLVCAGSVCDNSFTLKTLRGGSNPIFLDNDEYRLARCAVSVILAPSRSAMTYLLNPHYIIFALNDKLQLLALTIAQSRVWCSVQ